MKKMKLMEKTRYRIRIGKKYVTARMSGTSNRPSLTTTEGMAYTYDKSEEVLKALKYLMNNPEWEEIFLNSKVVIEEQTSWYSREKENFVKTKWVRSNI